MEDFRMSGKTLRILRVLFELSQEDVSKILNKQTNTTVSFVETGKRTLTKKDTAILIQKLDITMRDLMTVQKTIRTIRKKGE
ncbi:helix-turn-helix domain-containing protein [Bacillus sp. SG-1]|uniref:helix-turn-helix domain-containing protein n=1 Tax=Bacillus sp. SG-1 TaxID=161544 RepID=UPI0001543E7F|nr:helix-turn-helix transcriptional regulator [Bacillus sp. SG-1]EDL64995.1 hypothetical protein BSG1_14779 [Bacillus sp. SG-1]